MNLQHLASRSVSYLSEAVHGGDRFRGQKLLLFGASTYYGEQLSLQLALQGFQVIGVGSDTTRLSTIKREVQEVREQFIPLLYPLDPTDPQTSRQWFQEQIAPFWQVDVIVNWVEEYGADLFAAAPPESLPTSNSANPTQAQREGAIAPQTLWLQTYQQQLKIAETAPSPTWLIEVIPVPPNVSLEAYALAGQHRAIAFPTLYRSRIYLKTLKVPPQWITQEILNLLTQATESKQKTFPYEVVIEEDDKTGVALYFPVEWNNPLANQPATVQTKLLGDLLTVFFKDTALGRGVFASKAFQRGDRVLKTTGKHLSWQTEHSLQIGRNQHFEPDAPVRLINHSCEPNLGVKTNAQGLPDFFALKAIQTNEEVTFDYAMTEYSHYPRDNPTLEFDLTCKCGSSKCRGKLGYYSELPDSLKQAYAGFISQYLVQ